MAAESAGATGAGSGASEGHNVEGGAGTSQAGAAPASVGVVYVGAAQPASGTVESCDTCSRGFAVRGAHEAPSGYRSAPHHGHAWVAVATVVAVAVAAAGVALAATSDTRWLPARLLAMVRVANAAALPAVSGVAVFTTAIIALALIWAGNSRRRGAVPAARAGAVSVACGHVTVHINLGDARAAALRRSGSAARPCGVELDIHAAVRQALGLPRTVVPLLTCCGRCHVSRSRRRWSDTPLTVCVRRATGAPRLGRPTRSLPTGAPSTASGHVQGLGAGG